MSLRQVTSAKLKCDAFGEEPNLPPLGDLDLNFESNEEYIARRIRFAANCYTQEKSRASYWKILMRAKLIRANLIDFPKVQDAIKESLDRISIAESNGWS